MRKTYFMLEILCINLLIIYLDHFYRASNRQYKPAFNKSLNASSVLERNRNIDKYSSKTKINPTPLTQFQQWDNNRKQSEHLMKDHQHWLQKFRQEIGLERTGTSFSRRPGL